MTTTPVLSVPCGRNRTIHVYREHIFDQGRRIYYSDLESITYLLTTTRVSVYFIPATTQSDLSISLGTKEGVHKIKHWASSPMAFKTKERQNIEESFNKLVQAINTFAVPQIVSFLLRKFEEDGEVRVGKLVIDRKGLHRDRLFRRAAFLPWPDYFQASVGHGYLEIYSGENYKRPKVFFRCSTNVPNAVVLPYFLRHLVQHYAFAACAQN